MTARPVELRVDLARLVRVIAVLSVALVVVGLAVAIVRVEAGKTYRGLLLHLDLDTETSVPTWFSAMTLALGSCLLVVLAAIDRTIDAARSRRWMGLAAIVLLLSIDEVATFHEWSGRAFDLDRSGPLTYGWVILGLSAVAVVAAVYAPFVLRLEPWLRRLLVLAAGAFVAGALGMEMVNGAISDSYGEETLRYVIGTTAEEALEMTGAVLMLHALERAITASRARVHVHLWSARQVVDDIAGLPD